MAGHAGKLTREELDKRGPRMVLLAPHRSEDPRNVELGLVICREGQGCFRHRNFFPTSLMLGETFYELAVLSKSFSLSYLLRTGKGGLV